MAINDIFSKRQKRQRGEVYDVYQYDNMSNELRVQIVHIINDAFGEHKDSYNTVDLKKHIFSNLHKKLCREYGVFTLGKGVYGETDESCILNFIIKNLDVEKVLDVVELSFLKIIQIKENFDVYKKNMNSSLLPDEAISDLNERFKEHGFGYQFESGEIIRVDSTFMHSEVVKTVLNLITSEKFDGANEEFLNAHEHYRHGRNKECLNECLKAFESTLKIICSEKNWSYNEKETSIKLIQICLDNGLIPTYTQNQFSSLRSLLESGIPTIRNRLGGHGQGKDITVVDSEITRYALNLTGSNIIFLIELSNLK